MRERSGESDKVASANEAWQNAVQNVQRRNGGMDLWLGQVNCGGIADGRLLLTVPNKFTRDWISERYLPHILDEMKDVIPAGVTVEFRLESPAPLASGPRARPSTPPPCAAAASIIAPSAINPRFSFETFIEGPSNQLAVSACKAIARHAGRNVSPVFLWGPPGVGKTHLLCSVHKETGGRSPGGPVIFVSAEAFMNEFVESVAAGKMQQFRERYRRDCGMLLVDDIQFITPGSRTQEEFFHVFNELYNQGRPIAISSDRPPRDLGKMEQRLRSRFEWGLVADIRPPEVETRVAIARRKASDLGIEIPAPVANLVAESTTGSVREIEGALIRLDMQSSLSGDPITPDMARATLGLLSPMRSRKASAEDVQHRVATAWGVKASDLKGERRHRSVALPRQVAMYICRESLKLSYPEIGDRFGGRDHTTVMTACRKISGLVDRDLDLLRRIEAVTRSLEL